MLTRLRIKNFRLLKDVEIRSTPHAPLVLVGPNASGKSSILEVIDLLCRCAEDGLAAAIQAHGGIGSIKTAGSGGLIELHMRWEFVSGLGTTSPRTWNLEWQLSLKGQSNGEVVVVEENLRDGDREIVVTSEGKRTVFPEGDATKPSEIKSSNQLAYEALVDQDRFPALGLIRLVSRASQVLGALPTAPGWARDDGATASPRDSLVIGPRPFLSRQGFGLATMLYNLFTEHEEQWKLLEKSFRGEFPFVKRLVFPPDAGGSKIAFAFEDTRFPGRKFYASEMSDGMVAYLCLLAAVLNPKQIGVLGLDEPDSHLHPSALRRFMTLACRPEWRRLLIIVTHSNALLDELKNPAESIRIVEATREGTVLRKLDPAALASWRQEYSLSEMRRTGLLDHANSDYGDDVPAAPVEKAPTREAPVEQAPAKKSPAKKNGGTRSKSTSRTKA